MRSLAITCCAMMFLVSSVSYAQPTAVRPAGDGSVGDPFQIDSLANLYYVTLSDTLWGKNFIQTANIDASSSSSWNSGAGFSPIGVNFTYYFTGNYNGQGYAIDGVFINRPTTQYQAVFGVTGSPATIRNLGVTNVNITGANETGGLSADTYATTIDSCYSTGSVTGTDIYTGGLVAYAYSTTSISESFSTCTVTGTSHVGGFMGELGGTSTIANCYSRGNVTRDSLSSEVFGGFVGNVTSNQSISYSYSTGSVTYTAAGDPTDKGFIGQGTATVTQNFYDSETSSQSSATGALATSTADMKKGWTFSDSGWSMSIWYIDPAFNDGYPYLSWQPGGGSPVPVQIAAIDLQVEGEGVVLRWNTATEVDNAGFDVERRAISDLGSPISEWMRIGFVEGHGTVTSPRAYQFIDADLPPGSYEYRLKQVDRTGAFEYTREMRIFIAGTPQVFAIGQNYPNPFNPSTTLSYTLAQDGHVTLDIYDALGRRVARLVNEVQQAGTIHERRFDATGLTSGMYYARLEAGGKFQVQKMLLMK